MRPLFASAALAALLGAASPALGASYLAAAGGDAAVIAPFAWSGSSVDFYGHDPLDASAHTPVGLERADAAVVFLLQSASSGAGAVSLGVIFDAIDSGTKGAATVSVTGDTAGAVLAISEEASEFDAASLTGTYAWWDCCTDGFILDGLADDPLSVAVEFAQTAGLSALYVATPDGSGGAALTALGQGVPAVLNLTGLSADVQLAQTPVPAAMPLLAAGFAALGFARLRGQARRRG